MEILLLEDISKVGRRGDVVKVADGYARNFLIPKKKAIRIDASNRKMLEIERRKIEAQNRKMLEKQQLLSEQLQSLELEFVERAREGVLYGSVSANDIAGKLAENGFQLDPRQILIEDNIKQVGTHSIPLKLKDGIHANLTVHIISEE